MRRIYLLGAGLLVVLLLAIAQLALPSIATQRLRDRLGKSGRVLHLEVHAFPAIELLWHQADRVVVRVDRYKSSTSELSRVLRETGDVGSLDASANELDTGLVTLRNATLRKRGDDLTGTATVTESDLRSAIPILQSVQPLPSADGQLMLRGTANVLGVTATVDAVVKAENGRLVVQPNIPFGGLATLTVFGDPHIEVRSVSATGSSQNGFSVSAQARLR